MDIKRKISEAQEMLDPVQLDHAVKLIANARQVDIYSGRTTSIQRECSATAALGRQERHMLRQHRGPSVHGTRLGFRPRGDRYLLQRPCAQPQGNLADPRQPACPGHRHRHALLQRIHPDFAAHPTVSDHKSMTHRITQFASHIAVQYALDSLYSSHFAKDYARCAEFLGRSFPYTRLPGLK